MEALKRKADDLKAQNGSKLVCTLIFDEMSIRQHSQWNQAEKDYIGHVVIGKNSVQYENLPLAKDALVYMVSGLEDKFKIAIGYFLICGLTGPPLT